MSSDDEDVLLARQLQAEYDEEAAYHRSLQEWSDVEQTTEERRVTHSMRKDLSIVDPFWELNDPIPDIRGLFQEFDSAYFWGKLGCVEVKWSPRMTRCAGVCSYEGRGGLVSVRLSEPLLKLRPRKDLVETLLHEMIHAYLFVTRNFRDHDAHGEEFHMHMNRINAAAGAKITVYHNFHDEVANYRVHWWRCTGPCTQRGPFYGMVKRAMNRPPSARDPWWADHQSSCGGTFVKIKEPEPKQKRKRGDEKGNEVAKKLKDGQQDLFNLLPSSQKLPVPPSQPKPKRPALTESALHKPEVAAGVHVLNENVYKPAPSQIHHKPNVPANVHGFHSTQTAQACSQSQQTVPFGGKGHKLGGTTPASSGRPRISVSVQSTHPRQPTLADFLENRGRKQETLPTRCDKSPIRGMTNRRRSGSAMKFLHELLSSESEEEDDKAVLPSPGSSNVLATEELEKRLAASVKINPKNGWSQQSHVSSKKDWSQPSTSDYSSQDHTAITKTVPVTSVELPHKVERADNDDIMTWIVRSTSGQDKEPKSLLEYKTEKNRQGGAEMLLQGSPQHQDELMPSQVSDTQMEAAGVTVVCPVCYSIVPQLLMNEHLDTECILDL